MNASREKYIWKHIAIDDLSLAYQHYHFQSILFWADDFLNESSLILKLFYTANSKYRIIRCNRQAVLHSALFCYTPLVGSCGSWQKYAAHIIKAMQTGINRNKYTFCIMKSSKPPKNLKTRRYPLLRPSSLNFCKIFWKSILWDSPFKMVSWWILFFVQREGGGVGPERGQPPVRPQVGQQQSPGWVSSWDLLNFFTWDLFISSIVVLHF